MLFESDKHPVVYILRTTLVSVTNKIIEDVASILGHTLLGGPKVVVASKSCWARVRKTETVGTMPPRTVVVSVATWTIGGCCTCKSKKRVHEEPILVLGYPLL